MMMGSSTGARSVGILMSGAEGSLAGESRGLLGNRQILDAIALSLDFLDTVQPLDIQS